MKNIIRDLIDKSINECRNDGIINYDGKVEISITPPKVEEYGDFSSQIALVLASMVGMSPRKIAEEIISRITNYEKSGIESIEIAGPGFINFKISNLKHLEILDEISDAGKSFGQIDVGKNRRVQLEFVSANPTGPLHIGHGRGAVYGDVLANIMDAAGYNVSKEYYVNDAGGQIRTLGRSVMLRVMQMNGMDVDFPNECYQGNYISEIAKRLKSKMGEKLLSMPEESAVGLCSKYAADEILNWIKDDLSKLGIEHDVYFYEKNLHEGAKIEGAIDFLRKNDYIYEKDGAIWFKSSKFGDDKDRVLKKADGSLTYFAADIAYHKDKYDRGFDRVIDVWGADHGGYVARIKASIEAMGYDSNNFDAVLIQLVSLIKSGQSVSMSTRAGMYETLESVLNDVGADVCRYFFLMRSHNAHLDFDLDLAKKESPDNPVFYIQYAHARICSIFQKASESGVTIPKRGEVDMGLLNLPEETKLAKKMLSFTDIIAECAESLEPHRLAFYVLDLARAFQSYYSKGKHDARYRVLSDDKKLTASKLYLLKNILIVLQNSLRILGISAPERMARQEEGDA